MLKILTTFPEIVSLPYFRRVWPIENTAFRRVCPQNFNRLFAGSVPKENAHLAGSVPKAPYNFNGLSPYLPADSDRGQNPLHWGQTLGRKVMLLRYKISIPLYAGLGALYGGLGLTF